MKKEHELEAIASALKVNIDKLRAFIASVGAKESSPIIAERFITTSGKTGIYVRFPDEVEDPDMPVTEYMIRAFIARGGKVWDAENRIKVWKSLRWPTSGSPLWNVLKGSENYKIAYKQLPEQPTIGDLLSTEHVKLMRIEQNVNDGESMSFVDAMKKERDFPSPIHMLGLFLSLEDPLAVSAYFARYAWEWVGALTADAFVAELHSGVGDVFLDWDDPARWDEVGRVPASSSQ